MTFQESGLIFNFPRDWEVIKWDEHRFFGYVSGRGFKGVDFMGLRNNELCLIEVKNYQDRRPQDGQHPLDLVLAEPEFYAEKISQKFADSFSLIEIIQKYYLRKRIFKWWAQQNYRGLETIARIPFFQKSDLIFWTRAAQALHNQPCQVRLILWLEPGSEIPLEKYILLKETLLLYFEKKLFLPEGIAIEINNTNDPPFNLKVEMDQNF